MTVSGSRRILRDLSNVPRRTSLPFDRRKVSQKVIVLAGSRWPWTSTGVGPLWSSLLWCSMDSEAGRFFGVPRPWVRDYVDSFSSSKMRKAKFEGQTVFRELVRVSGQFGREGQIPPGDCEPFFLADRLMTDEGFVAKGLELAEAAGLIVRGPGGITIPGWEERQAKSDLSASRMRGFRAKPLELDLQPSLDRHGDGPEQRREEKRREEKVGLAPIEALFAYWQTVMSSPRSVLDPKRRRLGMEQLRLRGEEDCRLAVDGCKASKWHQGENDRKAKFNSFELIFRDAEHTEKFIELGRPKRPPLRAVGNGKDTDVFAPF